MDDSPLVAIGANARENWDLITDSEPEHIWVHLNSFPSPHVVIRSSNPSISEIEFAAELCKANSKYKKIKNIKVMYTRIDNLKLGDEIGSVNILSKRKCKYVIP
ncbi:unnamed protein product [Pylaiella littoralis]